MNSEKPTESSRLEPRSIFSTAENVRDRVVDEMADSTNLGSEDCFRGLLESGWKDGWRSRHPETTEYSWYSQSGGGFRIDHALASPKLDERIVSARYEHSIREAGISDHSALVIDVGAS